MLAASLVGPFKKDAAEAGHPASAAQMKSKASDVAGAQAGGPRRLTAVHGRWQPGGVQPASLVAPGSRRRGLWGEFSSVWVSVWSRSFPAGRGGSRPPQQLRQRALELVKNGEIGAFRGLGRRGTLGPDGQIPWLCRAPTALPGLPIGAGGHREGIGSVRNSTYHQAV